MMLSPDGHSLIVANNGYQQADDCASSTWTVERVAVVPLDDAWLGLAWHPDGTRLYVSGAAVEHRAGADLGRRRVCKPAGKIRRSRSPADLRGAARRARRPPTRLSSAASP